MNNFILEKNNETIKSQSKRILTKEKNNNLSSEKVRLNYKRTKILFNYSLLTKLGRLNPNIINTYLILALLGKRLYPANKQVDVQPLAEVFPKATFYRHLKTLLKEGLLEKRERKYTLDTFPQGKEENWISIEYGVLEEIQKNLTPQAISLFLLLWRTYSYKQDVFNEVVFSKPVNYIKKCTKMSKERVLEAKRELQEKKYIFLIKQKKSNDTIIINLDYINKLTEEKQKPKFTIDIDNVNSSSEKQKNHIPPRNSGEVRPKKFRKSFSPSPYLETKKKEFLLELIEAKFRLSKEKSLELMEELVKEVKAYGTYSTAPCFDPLSYLATECEKLGPALLKIYGRLQLRKKEESKKRDFINKWMQLVSIVSPKDALKLREAPEEDRYKSLLELRDKTFSGDSYLDPNFLLDDRLDLPKKEEIGDFIEEFVKLGPDEFFQKYANKTALELEKQKKERNLEERNKNFRKYVDEVLSILEKQETETFNTEETKELKSEENKATKKIEIKKQGKQVSFRERPLFEIIDEIVEKNSQFKDFCERMLKLKKFNLDASEVLLVEDLIKLCLCDLENKHSYYQRLFSFLENFCTTKSLYKKEGHIFSVEGLSEKLQRTKDFLRKNALILEKYHFFWQSKGLKKEEYFFDCLKADWILAFLLSPEIIKDFFQLTSIEKTKVSLGFDKIFTTITLK